MAFSIWTSRISALTSRMRWIQDVSAETYQAARSREPFGLATKYSRYSLLPGPARWATAERVSFGVEFRGFNCLLGNSGMVPCNVVSSFAILKSSQNRIH